MRHLLAASVLLISLLGCQSSVQPTPTALQGPPATFADFREEVLDPLAGKLLDEKIQEAHAQARFEVAKRERQRAEGEADSKTIDLLSSGMILVPGPGTAASAALKFLNNYDNNQRLTQSQLDEAKLKEFIAWTETQRGSLKQSILDSLDKETDRAKEQDSMFSLCVDHVTRKYKWNGARFALLSADPC